MEPDRLGLSVLQQTKGRPRRRYLGHHHAARCVRSICIYDPILIAEAKRKAERSKSRRTNRLVRDSSETIAVEYEIAPGVFLSGTLTAPPQLDETRVAELARMQMMAFFYVATYRAEERRGYFWRGPFNLADVRRRADWGNARMRAFMDSVVTWEPRILAISRRLLQGRLA